MTELLRIALFAGMATVTVVLLVGIFTLGRGKRGSSPAQEAKRSRQSNRLMILRLVVQAMVVVVFVLIYWLGR
ncbi:MAG: HIG1 domain-containing protein [Candidatus Pacebacteria bacterium]|nr:HIG1 domain-containing protein [Candidatus Paceibacterota bacterium]